MATPKVVPVLLLTIVIGSFIVGITEATWCVAMADASPEILKAAIDWACVRISCGPIQPHGACFFPNTLKDHASYAYDSYYQQFQYLDPNPCDFNGTAILTETDPSHGNCNYFPYFERSAGGSSNDNAKSKRMVTQKARKLAQTLPTQTQ